MNLLNEENAVRYVLQELKKNINFKWDHIHYLNKHRYAVVKGDTTIAILLKREPFMNFGRNFAKYGETGVGDSVNVDHLKEFISRSVKYIYTVFPDGKIYFIDIMEFLNNSYRWKQKEGTEVRSISIHKYKRAN